MLKVGDQIKHCRELDELPVRTILRREETGEHLAKTYIQTEWQTWEASGEIRNVDPLRFIEDMKIAPIYVVWLPDHWFRVGDDLYSLEDVERAEPGTVVVVRRESDGEATARYIKTSGNCWEDMETKQQYDDFMMNFKRDTDDVWLRVERLLGDEEN